MLQDGVGITQRVLVTTTPAINVAGSDIALPTTTYPKSNRLHPAMYSVPTVGAPSIKKIHVPLTTFVTSITNRIFNRKKLQHPGPNCEFTPRTDNEG